MKGGWEPYEQKCRLRKEVRKRVNFCAAQEERRRVQYRDKMFRSGNRYCFCTPNRSRGLGCRLRVNGDLLSDPQALLAVWADHFGRLSQSKVGTEPQLQKLECRVAELLSESYRNEKKLLDTPFCAEEVTDAVKKPKAGKAPGPDRQNI